MFLIAGRSISWIAFDTTCKNNWPVENPYMLQLDFGNFQNLIAKQKSTGRRDVFFTCPQFGPPLTESDPHGLHVLLGQLNTDVLGHEVGGVVTPEYFADG